ncbi:hypothetical protein B0H19DRAFT_1061129 [Mycena capillaripes]|nr:hypothetical protein B0H19DRAFT_1061129 [Mycena capillaripes]
MARTKSNARKSTSGPAPKWCSGCEDGGNLTQCHICPRYFCLACIVFPVAVTSDHVFYCPKCWLVAPKSIPTWEVPIGRRTVQGKAGNAVPYRGLWKDGQPLDPLVYNGNQSLRGQWPIIDTRRTVVISIRLEGMPLLGDAANLVFNHLAPYYRDSPAQLRLEDVSYNIDATNIQSFARKMDLLSDRLVKFAPANILIFITTHVIPEDGSMWIAPSAVGSASASQALPVLIPLKLQDLVGSAHCSLLVFQACGALHAGDARAQVASFVQTAHFQNALGFTVERFLLAAANTFLQDMVMSFTITHHAKSFSRVLASHCELGIHTDIILYFKDGGVYCYTWHHPALHPYRHPVPHQCPKCFAIASFHVVDHTVSGVKMQCKQCFNNLGDAEDGWTEIYPNGREHPMCRIESRAWKANKRVVEGAWYGEWSIHPENAPEKPDVAKYRRKDTQ